ncbi:MAG: ferredoxin [Candidatus Dormibacteria bacterium]
MSGSGPRLRVNPIRCDGARYCAEIVPELVGLDEWGYPIVASAPIEDPRLLRLAERAVNECPRVALQLAPIRDRGS